MTHLYRQGGLNIVLDTCSGSVHTVDDLAYEMIGRYENEGRDELLCSMAGAWAGREGGSREELAECYDQITELKRRGRLFTPDTFEPLAGELKHRSGGIVKALCLHVAHTCNLNCSYCFASQGKYHGERALMSYEVGRQALDFLVAHS
ncbi:MAG: thioether cross-link-forming SCIFF peptide maturase, partial [Clostridia bacterium]|nr:thioether cross-link-forming SCIFF peptide maturase [Clostridia bacterium]